LKCWLKITKYKKETTFSMRSSSNKNGPGSGQWWSGMTPDEANDAVRVATATSLALMKAAASCIKPS
jgi:hypothetical protein